MPGGGNTTDFKSVEDASKALYKLKPAQVLGDLNAAADYVVKLPASNGKLTSAGFCWGGGYSFRFATQRPDLKAAFVFYGMFQHTVADLKKIPCPVYGFYAENDARISKSLPDTIAQMKEAGKTFEPVTYAGPAMASCAPVKTPKAWPPIARVARRRGNAGRRF